MDNPTYQPSILLREDQGGIVRLVLNRPRKFNALSEQLLDRLETTLDEIKNDPTVRVVVIAANGLIKHQSQGVGQTQQRAFAIEQGRLAAPCALSTTDPRSGGCDFRVESVATFTGILNCPRVMENGG